jgi:hypothetical protein
MFADSGDLFRPMEKLRFDPSKTFVTTVAAPVVPGREFNLNQQLIVNCGRLPNSGTSAN